MRIIDADKLKKDVLDLQDCYNGFSDTYDKACIIGVIDEQPSAQPEPQWTPMSEHEPKFGNYLTTFREKATGNVDVAIDLYWSGGWDDDGNGKFETLAWMPLPEPWRGEGHGE